MNIPILRLIRPHIVAGGFLAFFLGVMLGITTGGNFNLNRIILFYLIVFFGDLSTHYSNDYYDVEVDKHFSSKKFFSGSNMLVKNSFLRPLARSVSWVLFLFSNLIAFIVVFFYHGPLELIILTLGANFLGLFYSAPPLRFVSRGIGEFIIALVTGFIIPSVGYLSVKGHFDFIFIYFSFIFVLYGLILSLSLSLPDLEIDRRSCKNTFVVRIGKQKSVFLIFLAGLISSILFLSYHVFLSNIQLNFCIIFLLSLIPFIFSVLSLRKILLKQKVNFYCTLNIFSLFLFNILMINYLMITFLFST